MSRRTETTTIAFTKAELRALRICAVETGLSLRALLADAAVVMLGARSQDLALAASRRGGRSSSRGLHLNVRQSVDADMAGFSAEEALQVASLMQALDAPQPPADAIVLLEEECYRVERNGFRVLFTFVDRVVTVEAVRRVPPR